VNISQNELPVLQAAVNVDKTGMVGNEIYIL